jgi:hypothetical protein
LRAYANYDTEVGYMPGLNFIAAALMNTLDPQLYENKEASFNKQSYELGDEFNEIAVFWMMIHIFFTLDYRSGWVFFLAIF